MCPWKWSLNLDRLEVIYLHLTSISSTTVFFLARIRIKALVKFRPRRVVTHIRVESFSKAGWRRMAWNTTTSWRRSTSHLGNTSRLWTELAFGFVDVQRLLVLPLVGRHVHLTVIVVVPCLPVLVLAVKKMLLVGKQTFFVIAEVIA